MSLLAIIDGRGVRPVFIGAGAAVAGALVAQARASQLAAAASAAAAALSEGAAESLVGPTYASTAEGIDDTVDGEFFAVDNGDGTVTIYLNDSETAVAQRSLATTAALASDAGPGLLGFSHDETYAAGTVGDKLKRFLVVTDSPYNVETGLASSQTLKLQDLFDEISASQVKTDVIMPRGRYRCDTGLTIDMSYVSIQASGAVLDFFFMTSGQAVTYFGTANPPWEQSTNRIVGLEIKGPGIDSDVDGVLWDTGTISSPPNEGSSHISEYSTNVHGFRVGRCFKDQAYIIFHYGCETWDCDTAISNPAGIVNGGENLSFIGGATYNCNLGCSAKNGIGAIHFSNHSIDYNVKQFEIDGSKVFFVNGHIESDDYPSSPVTVAGNGGFISITNSWLITPGTLPHSFDTFFDVAAGCVAMLRDSFAQNMVGTDGAWGKGDGDTIVGLIQGFTVPTNPYLQHATRSRLANGYFTGDIGIDNLFITEDASTPTSRHDGANLDLAISGGKLAFTKNFGSGAAAAFAWAVPVRPGEKAGVRLKYDKPGSNTGTMFISALWATLDESGAVPHYRYPETPFATITVVFTSSAVTSTDAVIGDGAINRAPSWATHLVLQINGILLDAGVVNLDALQMDAGG